MAKAAEAETAKLAIGLGRGSSGKSTLLREMIDRAINQGRPPIVADGDARSKTLSAIFPDAMTPPTEELPDNKAWLTSVLNRMAREKRSVVLDLGGGDRLLLEYGRDLQIIPFCERRGIEPVAIYVLGPEPEDLSHCLTIWDAGYFRPKRCILVLNEGAIKQGATVSGAFERTMADAGFQRMVAEGAKPFLLNRLAAIDEVKRLGVGFYAAADFSGDVVIDPVEQDMVFAWLADIEAKRAKAGVIGWLP